MHPAATRSIRIDDVNQPAEAVMRDVFRQYAELIQQRTNAECPGTPPDMRVGWLLWEDSLTEFLYFEERMTPPNPDLFYAEWNITPARGVRKPSKSLWVYDKESHEKRYSVTTSAGIKIQPYFDVPAPSDPHLYYFRVQSEPMDDGTVRMWVSASTASALKQCLGSLDTNILSEAIVRMSKTKPKDTVSEKQDYDLAVPILVTKVAHALLISLWEGVSDEHRAQLLLKSLV